MSFGETVRRKILIRWVTVHLVLLGAIAPSKSRGDDGDFQRLRDIGIALSRPGNFEMDWVPNQTESRPILSRIEALDEFRGLSRKIIESQNRDPSTSKPLGIYSFEFSLLDLGTQNTPSREAFRDLRSRVIDSEIKKIGELVADQVDSRVKKKVPTPKAMLKASVGIFWRLVSEGFTPSDTVKHTATINSIIANNPGEFGLYRLERAASDVRIAGELGSAVKNNGIETAQKALSVTQNFLNANPKKSALVAAYLLGGTSGKEGRLERRDVWNDMFRSLYDRKSSA